MWITVRPGLLAGPGYHLSTVIPNALTAIAAKLWIIRPHDMLIAVLFINISMSYWIINTCGKRAGLITRCKILLISSFACMYAPRLSAATCGRIVD